MAEKVSCCPSSAVEAVNDYKTAGSARPFLERLGLLQSMTPNSRAGISRSRVHTFPLSQSLPLSELQTALNGQNPPDKGQSLDWPYPDFERAEEET